MENITSFAQLRAQLNKLKTVRRIAVANAVDEHSREAALLAVQHGFAEVTLIGDESKMSIPASLSDLRHRIHLVHLPDDPEAAAREAVRRVRDGEADVLMKGLLNTSDFLRGVLDKEDGIRGEGILSHFATFETPGQDRLIVQTDGGMNMYPTLEEKAKILKNAVDALHRLGVERPNVAALSANEAVNEKMVSSVDADALQQMCRADETWGCYVEGPIALDVALSKEAARHKRIESRIAGETDLFLVPNIDAGNIMGKTLVCCAGAKMAGVVLGARAPIVLVSRSDNAESKLNSLALACALLES